MRTWPTWLTRLASVVAGGDDPGCEETVLPRAKTSPPVPSGAALALGVARGRGDAREAATVGGSSSSASSGFPKAQRAFQPPPRGSVEASGERPGAIEAGAAVSTFGAPGRPASAGASGEGSTVEDAAARTPLEAERGAVGEKTVEEEGMGLATETDCRFFHKFVPDAFAKLDKENFSVVKRSWAGSRGVKVKPAYMGPERVPVAVKIFPRSLLQTRERLVRDIDGYANPDLDRLGTEDPLTEIGVYQYWKQQPDQCEFMTRMFDVFEHATNPETWAVLTYCENGALIDYVTTHRQRDGCEPEELLRYTRQLLEAVQYMHSHNVAHRDISLENVLLCEKNTVLKVTDFGQAALLRAADGVTALRYFRICAKSFYRAPELTIPLYSRCGQRLQVPIIIRLGHQGQVVQLYEVFKAPEDVNNCQAFAFAEVQVPADAPACEKVPEGSPPDGPVCHARLIGWEAGPADMFSVGACLLAMRMPSPMAWRSTLPNDERFVWICRFGIHPFLEHQKKPMPTPGLAEVLQGVLYSRPSSRWTADRCLQALVNDVAASA